MSRRVLEIPAWDCGILVGPQQAAKQLPWEESATQNFALGTKLVMGDRVFRYCLNAGTALSKALMTSQRAVNTALKEIVQTGHTWAVGDVSGSVLITTGQTLADNELADGIMFANKVAAVGDQYRIMASKQRSTDTIVDIELEAPIRTAISATTEVTLHFSMYSKVVVFPTTAIGAPTGVPLIDVTANYYFWAQTGGPCAIITDAGDTVVIGEPAGKPGTHGTAGGIGVVANDGTDAVWGIVMSVGAAAEPSLIDLMLDRP